MFYGSKNEPLSALDMWEPFLTLKIPILGHQMLTIYQVRVFFVSFFSGIFFWNSNRKKITNVENGRMWKMVACTLEKPIVLKCCKSVEDCHEI